MVRFGSCALPFTSFVALLGLGCGSSSSTGSNGSPQAPSSVSSIAFKPTGSLSLPRSSTQQLQVIATNAAGGTTDVTTAANIKTDNLTVATVSKTGVISAIDVGTANITAAYQGVTTSEPITVSVPSGPISLQVSPFDSIVPADTTQQFTATSVNSDGSTSDVSAQVAWTSTDPSTSINSTGLLTVNAPTTTFVKATYQGLTASSLTVVDSGTTATPAATVFGNASDSHALNTLFPDGSMVDYFGSKDTDGLLTALTNFAITTSATKSAVRLDAAGHPTELSTSDGLTFRMTWSSDTAFRVSALTSYGIASFPVDLAKLKQEGSSVASGAMQISIDKSKPHHFAKGSNRSLYSKPHVIIPADAGVSTPTMTSFQCSAPVPLASVQYTVSSCGHPTDDAQPDLLFSGVIGTGNLLAELYSLSPAGGGSGQYNVTLPVLDPNSGSNAQNKCQAVVDDAVTSTVGPLGGQAVNKLCDFIDGLDTSSGLVGPETINTICYGAALYLLQPELAPLCARAYDTLHYACTGLANVCPTVGNTVDAYAATAQVTEEPSVTLAPGLILGLPNVSVQAPATGPFQCFNADFGVDNRCGVDHVTVDPNSRLMTVGDQAQLTAAAVDGHGQAVTSVTLDWSSDDPTVATVSQSGMVTASGVGSTTITVTEPKSGAADASVITVRSGKHDLLLEFSPVQSSGFSPGQLVIAGQDATTLPTVCGQAGTGGIYDCAYLLCGVELGTNISVTLNNPLPTVGIVFGPVAILVNASGVTLDTSTSPQDNLFTYLGSGSYNFQAVGCNGACNTQAETFCENIQYHNTCTYGPPPACSVIAGISGSMPVGEEAHGNAVKPISVQSRNVRPLHSHSER